MTDQEAGLGSKPVDPVRLAGAIDLTPEARAILTKQVNRRIVWGYKITKATFQTLALSPLLVSLFFLFIGMKRAFSSITGFLVVSAFMLVPAMIAYLLFRLASRL